MFTLVLGGARSGKSKHAQSLCHAADCVAYIATSRVEDDEMRARVARHQADRPSHWRTIEQPLHLAEAVRDAARHAQVILIDCLTVWLSNFMWHHRDDTPEAIEAAMYAEFDAMLDAAGAVDVVAVSNEVGFSLVPESAVGRLFRDLQGFLNQRAAARAGRVLLTVAGIAIPIKSEGQVFPNHE